MSGDEVFILMISLAASVAGFVLLVARVSQLSFRHPSGPARIWLSLAPLLGAALVLTVLLTLASFDVRGAPQYILLYLALGVAWMLLSTGLWVGVSPRDDVGERGNTAALWLWSGAVVGAAACYAGANVGDGPGWWCVVWAAALATGGWLLCWALLQRATRILDHVTIDRDVASGIRAASFLTASGILWGRGGAGDWTSAFDTVAEMRAAWPALLLFAKAVLCERWAMPRPSRPVGELVQHGWVPALLDVPLVALGLYLAGPLPNSYRTEAW